jgi:hypothetical protein
LNGRSSFATTEELLLTTAVGEATARPVGYASVAETEDVVELPPPPPPHATKKTSDASEMAGNLKLIVHSPKTKHYLYLILINVLFAMQLVKTLYLKH